MKYRDKTMIVMFICMALAFGLLAWRSEQNAIHIREAAYNQCVARNANMERSNAYFTGMIWIERNNPYQAVSPETVAERIKLYRGAIMSPIACHQ